MLLIENMNCMRVSLTLGTHENSHMVLVHWHYVRHMSIPHENSHNFAESGLAVQ
jgi:hypothetical protein